MPYVSGFLRVGGSGGHPDQGLPGHEGAVDPGYGIDLGGHIDNTLPPGPPNVFPPLTPSHPIAPAPPGTPPGTIWPPLWSPVDPGYGHGGVVPPHVGGGPMPGSPGHPSGQPVPPPAGSVPRPDQGLPAGPARPDNTLPSQVYWVVVGVPGVGWRYACIDPSLTVGYPLPEAPPGRPDNALPPTATPRR